MRRKYSARAGWRVVSLMLLVITGIGGLSAQAAAEVISLRSHHGLYVVAESNGTANANRRQIGPWEKWLLIRHGDGTVSLRGHHGGHLVAESNGAANSNRPQIGAWERWRMTTHGDGTVSFLSHHNRYLVAESNGGLNANRPNLGPWERFHLLRDAPPPPPPPAARAPSDPTQVASWSALLGESSWTQADSMCKQQGMRLPTQKEIRTAPGNRAMMQAWNDETRVLANCGNACMGSHFRECWWTEDVTVPLANGQPFRTNASNVMSRSSAPYRADRICYVKCFKP